MRLTDDEVRARIATIPHWYHPIEVRPGIITPGANAARLVLETLDLPADCHGMRVLDLGTRDGFFAFELERRGATVVAVDYLAMTESGFAVAAELLDFRVTHLQRNLYDLTVEALGTFDIVLFLGLLDHRSARRIASRPQSDAASDVSRNAGARLRTRGGRIAADAILCRLELGR